jgi:D-3-phosphoglycerate dehydrogenase
VPALSKRKIPLMTTGIANSVSVAEHAMYMLPRLGAPDQAARPPGCARPAWHERLADQPVDLAGKSILVVGMGRIGSRTVKRCVAFEMDTYVLDPNIRRPISRRPARRRSPTSRRSCPRSTSSRSIARARPRRSNMFNAETSGLMKPDAFLVNTARGGIVNEDALYTALTTGKLRGAGLDVLDASRPTRNKLFEPGERDLQPAHGGRHQGGERPHGDRRHGEHPVGVRRQADRRPLREQGNLRIKLRRSDRSEWRDLLSAISRKLLREGPSAAPRYAMMIVVLRLRALLAR